MDEGFTPDELVQLEGIEHALQSAWWRTMCKKHGVHPESLQPLDGQPMPAERFLYGSPLNVAA